MTACLPSRIGMDLITFFNAPYWGVESYQALRKPGSVPPDVFWDRVLDELATTGIEGIELTAGIASYQSALERYGTAEKFSAALLDRGLVLCSGFYPGLVYVHGSLDSSGLAWREPTRQAEILEEVADYADFIVASGSQTMVMGLPLRTSWDNEPPTFVDLAFASELADLINRMGYTAMKHGVRIALHTETRSSFWLRRDIDLFMALTDPVYIDMCPDTAHIATGGSDPSEIFEAHHTRIAVTHWKDVTGTVAKAGPIDENSRASMHQMYARVGTGIIDWHRWVRTLEEHQFTGWAIIELDSAPDPGPQLTAAREYMDLVTRRTPPRETPSAVGGAS